MNDLDHAVPPLRARANALVGLCDWYLDPLIESLVAALLRGTDHSNQSGRTMISINSGNVQFLSLSWVVIIVVPP